MNADPSSNGLLLLVLSLNALLAGLWLRPRARRWGLGLLIAGGGLLLLAGTFIYQGHLTAASAPAAEAVAAAPSDGSAAQPVRRAHRIKKHKKARHYQAPAQ